MDDGYYAGFDAFNEYMNWALVSLRYANLAPAVEQGKLIGAIEK